MCWNFNKYSLKVWNWVKKRVKKSVKYHLKIISMIIHLNFYDYLLKNSHWHFSDIWLSLLYINYISLKFQCSFQTVYLFLKCLFLSALGIVEGFDHKILTYPNYWPPTPSPPSECPPPHSPGGEGFEDARHWISLLQSRYGSKKCLGLFLYISP